MSRSALSAVVDAMKANGSIKEQRSGEGDSRGVGRPAGLLVAISSGPPTLAIEVGITGIRVAAVDAEGAISHLHETALPLSVGRDATIRAVSELAVEVRSLAGGLPRAVIALPTMVDGLAQIVDPAGGRARMPSWTDGRTVHALEQSLGMPCVIQNNTMLATIAEQRLGAGTRHQTFLYVNVTQEGLGSGLVVGGRQYVGAHGRAGQISHISMNANGVICPCGQRGCVAAESSNQIRLYLESVGEQPGREGYRNLAASSLTGDPAVRRLFQDIGSQVGRAVGGVVNTLDPEAVIIQDSLTEEGDDTVYVSVSSVLAAYIHPGIRDRITVTPSEVGRLAPLHGCGLLDAQRTFPDDRGLAVPERPLAETMSAPA